MGEFTEIADLRPRTTRDGLQVDAALAAFLENDVLAPLALDASAFFCCDRMVCEALEQVLRGTFDCLSEQCASCGRGIHELERMK